MLKFSEALKEVLGYILAEHIPYWDNGDGDSFDTLAKEVGALIASAQSLEKRCLILEDEVHALEAKLGDDLEDGTCPECRVNDLGEGELVCEPCFKKDWLTGAPDSDNAVQDD